MSETATDTDLELFEMANLEPDKTGVDGIVYISTRQGAHGPRVKFYKRGRVGREQPSFSVSVAEEPELVATDMAEREVARHLPTVIEFVRLNRAQLEAFWNDGHTWLSDEVHAFLNAFVRVP